MNKIILMALLSIFFTACVGTSIEEQRATCIKDGKKFYTKKFLNMRTGEYEIKGECR